MKKHQVNTHGQTFSSVSVAGVEHLHAPCPLSERQSPGTGRAPSLLHCSPLLCPQSPSEKKTTHACESQQGNMNGNLINEQYNNVKANCFRGPRGPYVSSISKCRLNLDDSDWDWQESCYFPRGLRVVLSCIVSTSVLVLRVNLEEKQKWRLYMTHYLSSQRGNSSHNSGLAYLCTVMWSTS